jgi:hypothetical protein
MAPSAAAGSAQVQADPAGTAASALAFNLDALRLFGLV